MQRARMHWPGEAINIMRDLVLAHGAVIGHARERDAETTQRQHAMQVAMGGQIALRNTAGPPVELVLVGLRQRVRGREIVGAQQAVRHPPIDLRHGAGEAIGKTSRRQKRWRRCRHAKVDEHTGGGVRGQRHLQAIVQRDGRGRRRIAVHGGRRGKYAVTPLVQAGDVFTKVVDGSRADRDNPASIRQPLRQHTDRRHIGMRPFQDHRFGGTDACERCGNASPQSGIGALVSNHREPVG